MNSKNQNNPKFEDTKNLSILISQIYICTSYGNQIYARFIDLIKQLRFFFFFFHLYFEAGCIKKQELFVSMGDISESKYNYHFNYNFIFHCP